MTGNINYDYISEYIRSLISENSGFLKEMEIYAFENHVPIVEKETAQFLRCILYMKRPEKILEIGTAIGYSSIIMSDFLSSGGLIITVERDEDMVKRARENIAACGKGEKIKVIADDAVNVLSSIDGEYDIIFLDANKSYYKAYFPDCMRILKKGGLIISDNIMYKGMIAKNEEPARKKRTIVKNIREYLDMISSDDRLMTSVIPIGDGVALSIKK